MVTVLCPTVVPQAQCSGGSHTQVSVTVGLKEARVDVILHQAVDFPLCFDKADCCWQLQILSNGVSCVEIQVDLRHRNIEMSKIK